MIKKIFKLTLFLSSLMTLSSLSFASEIPALAPGIDESSVIGGTQPEYVVIRSSDQATFSSETAASVSAILVKEGSQFHKGDTLLELDCRLQKAELKKAVAQQQAAKLAQISAKKLKSYGSISDFELVKATTDADIANAEVDKLNAIVDKCIIKAPYNGSVAEIMTHPFETVKQGDPLLRIVNLENLDFELQVPSSWLQWLHIGSKFNVQINEVNKVVPATITKINPQIEPVSQTVKVIGTIAPGETMLLPGMSGQASFPDNPANKPLKK